jgi:hypothetical protein
VPKPEIEVGMRNAPEVVREVGVDDFRVATEQHLFHLDHRLLGISPGTVCVLFGWKVGFEDRFQHQHRCCHADPITQGRDAQWPEFGAPAGRDAVVSSVYEQVLLHLAKLDREVFRERLPRGYSIPKTAAPSVKRDGCRRVPTDP